MLRIVPNHDIIDFTFRIDHLSRNFRRWNLGLVVWLARRWRSIFNRWSVGELIGHCFDLHHTYRPGGLDLSSWRSLEACFQSLT